MLYDGSVHIGDATRGAAWPEAEVPKTRGSNVLPVAGIVLLLIPAYLAVRWIRIFGDAGSHDARVAEFSSILPHALQDPLASTVFALACAVAGTAAGAVGLVRFSGLRRPLCAAMLGIGGLLSAWFVWTLL